MNKFLKAALGFTLCLGAPSATLAGPLPALFQTAEFRNGSLDALPQWQRVMAEVQTELPTYQACTSDGNACTSRSMLAWQTMLKGQRGNSRIEQVRAVNRFVNRWEWRADQQNYGRSDYWASPVNFLQRSGDCEDYVIIKYVSLRQLGFDAEELRLVVVKDLLRDLAHAVLAVHVENDIYILDNLSRAALPQAKVTQYAPYYSVNENARFAHIPTRPLLISAVSPPAMPGAGPALQVTAFAE
jgi:predicted transglutaminase-like cysteine proteinase